MRFHIQFLIAFIFPLCLIAQGKENSDDFLKVNGKSLSSIQGYFENYSGFSFQDSETEYLSETTRVLDSLEHDVYVYGGYRFNTKEELEARARLLLLENIGKSYSSGYLMNTVEGGGIEFFVVINNDDLSPSEIEGYQRHITSSVKDYFYRNSLSGSKLLDAISYGQHLYTGIISGSYVNVNLVEEFDLDDEDDLLQPEGGPGIRSPLLHFTEARLFLSPSGVPFPLPTDSYVRFYPLGHDSQGAVKAFRLKSDNYKYLYDTRFWTIHPEYKGDFAGYGYDEPVEHGVSSIIGSTIFSYENFIAPENAAWDYLPPYIPGQNIEITLGVVEECDGKVVSRYFTEKMPFEVTVDDISNPEVNSNLEDEGLTSYSCAGKFVKIRELIPDLDMKIIQWAHTNLETFAMPHLYVPERTRAFNCIVDSVINLSEVNRVLESDDLTYVGRIETEGRPMTVTAFKLGERHIISFLPFDDSFQPEYMAWDPVFGWVPVDGVAHNPSQGIFQLCKLFGTMLATGAFVYLSVAAGAFGGTVAVLLVGEGSAYATVAAVIGSGVFDIAFAGGEAGLMYYINGDSDNSWRTFKQGVIFAGIGSAGELILKTGVKAFQAYRYGEGLGSIGRAGANFDIIVKIQKIDSEEFVEVSLKQFESKLKSKFGLSDDEVKALFSDIEDGKVARSILLDNSLVYSWLALRRPNSVVGASSSVNMSGIADINCNGICGPVAIALDFRLAGVKIKEVDAAGSVIDEVDATASLIVREYNNRLHFPLFGSNGGTFNRYIENLYTFLGKKQVQFRGYDNYDQLNAYLKSEGVGTRGLVSAQSPSDAGNVAHLFNVRVKLGSNNQLRVEYLDAGLEGPANIVDFFNNIKFMKTD